MPQLKFTVSTVADFVFIVTRFDTLQAKREPMKEQVPFGDGHSVIHVETRFEKGGDVKLEKTKTFDDRQKFGCAKDTASLSIHGSLLVRPVSCGIAIVQTGVIIVI
jgi:hypothetical protein